MSWIESIKELLRTASEIEDKVGKVNTKSVARGADDQTFHFPALIDENIPVEEGQVITKQLDRVYASWTQIYLSSIGVIDLNYVRNPRQFLAKYQPKFTLEDGDSEEEDFCESALRDTLYGNDELFFAEAADDNCKMALITPGSPNPSLLAKSKAGVRPYMEGVNVLGIQKPGELIYEDNETDEMLGNLLKNAADRNRQVKDDTTLRSTKDAHAPRITESDIKKLNDMAPYVLELKLLAGKGQSSFSQWINYLIGVKTTCHLASSNMLVLNIVNVLKNRNGIFNFIRWTTGEISLIKDLILHIDDINFDIANKSDRTGKFISSLKRLKKKYLRVGPSFGVTRMAPFATIVISSNTYFNIKDNYGFDLKNMTFAKKVMEELFLMCFVIIDDVTHTVDLLVDGQNDFQTYALETLEREVTMSSNKLGKELTRMLGASM